MRSLLRPLAAALSCLTAAPADAAAISATVTLQTWTLCPGSSVDARCAAPDIDAGYLDRIYAQIGVRVILAPAATLFGFAFPVDDAGDVRANMTLSLFRSALDGAGALVPGVAHAGFTPAMSGAIAGLSFEGIASSPVSVIESQSGNTLRETVILAHELAHVLGASHAAATSAMNLVYAQLSSQAGDPDFMPVISEANAAAILSSPLLVATSDQGALAAAEVPVPASAPMLAGSLAAALAGVVALRRRRD